ncbi:polysaccharide biosynthesis family protein, partial [Striga asiatica]
MGTQSAQPDTVRATKSPVISSSKPLSIYLSTSFTTSSFSVTNAMRLLHSRSHIQFTSAPPPPMSFSSILYSLAAKSRSSPRFPPYSFRLLDQIVERSHLGTGRGWFHVGVVCDSVSPRFPLHHFLRAVQDELVFWGFIILFCRVEEAGGQVELEKRFCCAEEHLAFNRHLLEMFFGFCELLSSVSGVSSSPINLATTFDILFFSCVGCDELELRVCFTCVKTPKSLLDASEVSSNPNKSICLLLGLSNENFGRSNSHFSAILELLSSSSSSSSLIRPLFRKFTSGFVAEARMLVRLPPFSKARAMAMD